MNHLMNYYDCYIELHKFNEEGLSETDCINFMATELHDCMNFVKNTIEYWDPEKNHGYEIISWSIREAHL